MHVFSLISHSIIVKLITYFHSFYVQCKRILKSVSKYLCEVIGTEEYVLIIRKILIIL